MNPLDILAVVIIALVPFNVGVTVFLFYLLGGHPDLVTLRVRAYTQFFLTLCSGIGGIFGIAYFIGAHLNLTLYVFLLSALILLPSVPGLYWVKIYLSGELE